MIDIIREAWKRRSEAKDIRERFDIARRSEAKDIRERFDIARRFNDRYTYRVKFVLGTDTLPGTFYGSPTDGGNAWMCPQCNRIHHPVSCSVFSGLQYPACCSTGEGNRLSHGIRTR